MPCTCKHSPKKSSKYLVEELDALHDNHKIVFAADDLSTAMAVCADLEAEGKQVAIISEEAIRGDFL